MGYIMPQQPNRLTNDLHTSNKYLDRSEPATLVYTLYTRYHSFQWREVLLLAFSINVMAAVVKMVEKQRSGEDHPALTDKEPR